MNTHIIQSIFPADPVSISDTLVSDSSALLAADQPDPKAGEVESNWLTRKYRVSINKRLIDKVEPDDIKDYAKRFVSRMLTIDELALCIGHGYAYGSHYHNEYRKTGNFQAADLVSVDIDEGMTLEQARNNPLVQRAATMIYTTASHTPEAHRFRIVFGLSRTITDSTEFSSVMRSLALRFNSDGSTVDGARMFYGSRNAKFGFFDRGIDDTLLSELIEQSMVVKKTSKKNEAAATYSCWKIPLDRLVQAADGSVATLLELPKGTRVHCPHHDDKTASAFVLTNKNNQPGVRCSTCNTTYYSEDPVFDFYTFDQEAKQAAGQIVEPEHVTVHDVKDMDFSHSKIHYFNEEKIKSLPLVKGVSLIKSPKDTGKSTILKKLTRENTGRILLIGHRQTLIGKMCKDLQLNCYLDDKTATEKKQKLQSRYGVCLDSLTKVGLETPYDYVLIDESEQVLAHFLSKTMADKNNNVLQRLIHILANAEHVIALDADLSSTTFDFITNWSRDIDPDKLCNIYINEYVTERGVLELYRRENQLIGELHKAIGEGRKVFVTSNSRKQIHRLEATIKKKMPEAKIIAITAKTVEGKNKEPVRRFIKEPKVEAKKYDVVLASPSLGTGVDITFDGGEKYFDVVFGIFQPDIISHFDCDQQLARVRHPGAVKVFVSPQTFNYETQIDVTRNNLLETTMHDRLLGGYSLDGKPIYNDQDDQLLLLATAVISRQRASINNLKRHFVEYKKREGWTIVETDDDDELWQIGKAQTKLGKSLSAQEAEDRLLNATSLTDDQYEVIGNHIRGKQYVSDQDRANYDRSQMERFYKREISRELIDFDDNGRRRQQVRLFEAVTNKKWRHLADLFLRDHDREQTTAKSFIRNRHVAEELFIDIMKTLPVYNNDEFLPDVVFSMEDLGEFVAFVTANKAKIEAQFRMDIRKDLTSKPMMTVGVFMKMVGLALTEDHTKTTNGHKTYFMKIDPEKYNQMQSGRSLPT